MLKKSIIEDVFNIAIANGGDFAEVFIEDNFTTDIDFLGGRFEEGMSGKDFGIGIRILNGLDSIYVYTNDLSKDNLIKMTKNAVKNLMAKGNSKTLNFDKKVSANKHNYKILPDKVKLKKKKFLMKKAYEAAINYDKVISQASIKYFDQVQNVLIANTEGVYVKDHRVRTRMLINVTAESEGKMESGYVGPGALRGLEFYDTIDIEEYAKDAARNAKVMVHADHSPVGNMPVVIDNGFGGLMFHEACGHSLEASSVSKGISVFSDKIGEKVASELVTLVDDGSIPNEWGSGGVDDEGKKTQKNVLIKDGILQDYLIDRLNGRRMGKESNASGRRSSYRYAPTSRMSNTYIDNGESTKEEIISNTEYGLFAKNLSAGSVDPATGDFNFSLAEAYLIEDGKISKPVKGATLIGNGAKILQNVDMVADNLKIGQGFCFAASGPIFIGAGQPTLRVKSLRVGGRDDQ